MEDIVKQIDFDKLGGLVTAIAVDDATGDILMVAYMNEESLRLTLQKNEVVYWSRSRKKLWHKGEQSGNVQRVKALYVDCDADAVLIRVEQIGGAACHTGQRSCFYRKLENGRLVEVSKPIFDPKKVYGQ